VSAQPGRQPTEEELRAALEEQLRRLHIRDLLTEQIVTTLNLAFRRTGLQPGTEGERDLEQVALGVEAVRTLLPLLGDDPQYAPLRDALSQLQMAYVRVRQEVGGAEPAAAPPSGAAGAAAGPAGPGGPGSAPPPKPGAEEAGPAQRSGRLWVPGQ
jgi:hypothetical protein